ncbi:MAG: hypothetical protein Q8J89_05990 [Caulobacter sp.]|nr:hypothetical protein [Caulobacter sp.]
MNRVLLIAAASLSLAACATPTVYAPSTGAPTSVGFTDYRIETGRYRVSYTGGGGAPMAQVADYALLRAAEVALRDGYDWFRVVDRQDRTIGAGAGGRPRVSVGVGSGGGGWGRRSGVSVGVGTSFDLSGGPALSRTLEVMAGKGPVPKDRDVYDARDIVRVIGRGEGR